MGIHKLFTVPEISHNHSSVCHIVWVHTVKLDCRRLQNILTITTVIVICSNSTNDRVFPIHQGNLERSNLTGGAWTNENTSHWNLFSNTCQESDMWVVYVQDLTVQRKAVPTASTIKHQPRSQASPVFCSSVCIQYNTRKRKSVKNGVGLGTPITWMTSGGRKVDVRGERVRTKIHEIMY